MGFGWRPYVPVAARRARAARELARRERRGGPAPAPVRIDGRTIARTFWGKAWCDNLERYSDFSNRLPRGRTYVRNGSVVDLQLAAGQVTATVSGSALYDVVVTVARVAPKRWTAVRADCAGAIDSLVELLQGRLSDRTMARICEPRAGLFPEPRELTFACSCPDWASMCKHVAAVLYGVGARLDERPELLFTLRGVDAAELVTAAAGAAPRRARAPAAGRVLLGAGLSELFGIDLATDAPAPGKRAAPARTPRPKPKPAPARGQKPTPKKPTPAGRATAAPARRAKPTSARRG
jgi:hypothetical protein